MSRPDEAVDDGTPGQGGYGDDRARRAARAVPDRDEIAALPPFERLGIEHITPVSSASQADAALSALSGARLLGFDTESKPTFNRGETSDGPHVVQFATLERAWVFQLRDPRCRQVVANVLHNEAITKVGFGLATDRARLAHNLGVVPAGLVDVDTIFRGRGYRKEVGVKVAVALVFDQRFVKSRKVTTSNWASERLSEAQLVYAANDAYAAIRVYEALGGA